MSSLLTSDTELLRAPAWRAPPEPHPPARDPEIEALEARVRELETALKESEETAAEAIRRARVEAREEAEAAIVRDEVKRFARVETAMREALAVFQGRVGELDALALVISETALEKVFARRGDFKDLITRAIELQVGAVHRDALVRLEVSGADFADDRALQALGAQIGETEIGIGRELQSGEARLVMRLGEIELSLARHWDALKQKLRGLAHESTPP